MKRRLLLEKSSEEEGEALTMRLRFREKVRVEGREGLNKVVESEKVSRRVAIGSRFVSLSLPYPNGFAGDFRSLHNSLSGISGSYASKCQPCFSLYIYFLQPLLNCTNATHFSFSSLFRKYIFFNQTLILYLD